MPGQRERAKATSGTGTALGKRYRMPAKVSEILSLLVSRLAPLCHLRASPLGRWYLCHPLRITVNEVSPSGILQERNNRYCDGMRIC
jgi:hypothetical protein